MGAYNRVFKGETGGNYMELSESKKQIYYEGELNTGVTAGQFNFYTGGTAIYNVADTTLKMDVAGLLNFPMPPNAVKIMFDTLNYQSGSAKPTQPDPVILKPALIQVLKDGRNKQRVLDDLNDKSIRLVSELERTLFFSHISLQWDQATRSFISSGELSLNSIEKYKIERKLNGRLQITKKRTGDDFALYLESPEGSWYYFKYNRNMLYALSSDAIFNKYIREDGDKLSKKYDNYKLRIGNIAERNKFVRQYKTDNRK
jgi:hypothetical protein